MIDVALVSISSTVAIAGVCKMFFCAAQLVGALVTLVVFREAVIERVKIDKLIEHLEKMTSKVKSWLP